MKRSKSLKRKGSHPITKLKHKLDALVSKLVRERSKGVCYTCGRKYEGKLLHCGHFIGRGKYATRYDPDNLRAQCIGCNMWKGGELGIFAGNLIEELGLPRFQKLVARSRTIKQWDRKDLELLIEAAERNWEDYEKQYRELSPESV